MKHKEKFSDKNNQSMEDIMNGLDDQVRFSKLTYILIIVLYIATTVLLAAISNSESTLNLFGNPVPLKTLAGVLSSLANICIILLVVFYKKIGFITALVILGTQFPMLIRKIFVLHVYGSIPGIFTNIFTLIAAVIIFVSDVKLAKYQKGIRKQAITDRLTGLLNRFACYELMDDLIEKKENFALVMIDLNNFREINDSKGHTTGNEVLKVVAKRWGDCANSNATGTLDFVTRQSGDEFMLVIRKYLDDEDIMDTIRHFEKVLEEKVTIDECEYYLSASFGYAEYPADADNADTLFTCANTAMYEIKKINSSNHILRFTKDLLREEHTLEMERKLRIALENSTVYFNLQPQYTMDHKLRGFEALARMRDEAGQIVSPGEFIPVAEKIGIIDKVDSMVFKKSAELFGRLLKETGADITLSLNASVKHLMKSDFLDELKSLLDTYEIPAGNLEIEITESIMLDSADKALACINKIKDMGIKIAIDDFGTGYSSLSYLSKVPADLLKIDKSFIDEMNNSDASKKYVAAIVSMGHIMNMEVISEGVEDDAQIETLREIGCDFIQGFVWGRPLPAEEAEALVKGLK